MLKHRHAIPTSQPILRLRFRKQLYQVPFRLAKYLLAVDYSFVFLLVHVLEGDPFKWGVTGEELVEEDAQTVEVDGLVVWLAVDDLGGEVLQGPA